ncbi:SCO7613 C-terminal domain-containing membrane protein [Embleya sp. NBC_00896]|uniref:SCO7613 C-terminal domain-containing membrane protein n=1 Tax=Embleya sp. NBC_00896 TaxID=2975961 RepID=UPI00386C4887|nr:hypothetical protein OG928_05285 [Embleya sp. NBC_00896]
MLDERLLEDPTRCPNCALQLREPRTKRCRGCAITLTGPTADQVWRVGLSAAHLLREREGLLKRMRIEAHDSLTRSARPAAPPAAPATVPAMAPAETAETAVQPPPQAPRSVPTPPRPSEARLREMAEVGRRRVARIVLGAGVLLVVVAALVFVAVTWNRTGTAGRALVMAFALVLAAVGTAVAERRELPATAEAMAALTVAMGLLDGFAAWSADLAGLRGGDALLVTAGTLLAVGGAAALGSMLAPLRALRVSAGLLLQGPLPLLVASFGTGRDSLLPLAIGLGLQAAVDVVLLRWTHAKAARGLRIVAEVGVLCYWLAAVGLTFAQGEGGASAGTMLGLAAIAGGIAYTLRGGAVVRHMASGSAMFGSLSALALLLAAQPRSDESDLPIAWAGVGLLIMVAVLLAVLFAVPRPFRAGPIAVLAPLTAAPAFWAVAAVATAGFGPVSWTKHTWDLNAVGGGTRGTVTATGGDWTFGLAPLALWPLWAVVAVLGAALFGRRGRTLAVVFAGVALEALLVVAPVALDLPLWAALGWHVVVALALGCTGRVREWLPAVGAFHCVLAVLWSTANPMASIVVWAVAAAGLAGAAVLLPARPAVDLTKRDRPAGAPGRRRRRPGLSGTGIPHRHRGVRRADPRTGRHRSAHPRSPGAGPLLRTPIRGRRRPDPGLRGRRDGGDPRGRVQGGDLSRAGPARRARGPGRAARAAPLLDHPHAARRRRRGLGDRHRHHVECPRPARRGLGRALLVGVAGAIRDLPTLRPAWSATAAIGWVGAVAAGAHAFGADRPATGIAALVAAALLIPAATPLSGLPSTALALEGTAAAAMPIALVAGRETSPVAFAIAAAAALYGAVLGRTVLRPAWAPATAGLLYATTAATLHRLDVGQSGQAVALACAATLLLLIAPHLHDAPKAALAVEGVAAAAALIALAASGDLLPIALGVVAAGTLHGAFRGRTVLRPGWAPATVVLGCAAVPATLHRLDIDPAWKALAAVGAAALVYIGTARLPRPQPPTALAAAACAFSALGVTLVVAPERSWIALAATGLAALTTPTGPLRLPATIAAAPLLFAAYWVRVALFGVEQPEAYTLPLGVALLIEGLLRRRARPDTNSWAAYGGPLAVLLLPSLPLAVAQGEPIRPSLLGLAAIATLLIGARFRLQAPLFLGAAVIATVGLVHLLPHLAPVYDAVPRWAVLGTAGLLLIVIGAGYERRLRDLKRLRRAVGRLN